MYKKLKLIVSEWYFALMNTPGKIDDVAWGFAIGFFIGMFPWYGLQTALSLIFTRLFKKSMAAGVLGSVTSNPLTMMPLFYVEYTIGRWILKTPRMKLPDPFSFDLAGLVMLWDKGADALHPIMAGSLVVGLLGSVISFFLVRRALTTYRKRIYGRRRRREVKPHASNS